MDLDAPLRISALYADSLMFSGKYFEAKDVFSKYLENSGDPHDEWHLKSICLESIIEEYGVKEQSRNIQKAIELADIVGTKESGELISKLEKALREDMLCGLAWFNLGIEKNKLQNNHEAAFCFTMCGLIQTGDEEAWVNATLCSFDKRLPVQILVLTLRTAYFFNGEKYLSLLYQRLSEQQSSEAVAQISEIIEHLVPKEEQPDIPEVRIMGEKGLFKNIFDKKKE